MNKEKNYNVYVNKYIANSSKNEFQGPWRSKGGFTPDSIYWSINKQQEYKDFNVNVVLLNNNFGAREGSNQHDQ